MKKKHIEHYSAEEIVHLTDHTDWERVDALSEEDIEKAMLSDADSERLPEDWPRRAEAIVPEMETEEIRIRVDRDVAEFFRSQGGRLQSRVNAVLRAFVLAQRRKESR